MFTLIGWVIYGLICGLCAKALHPGDDPVGFLPTLGIGVAGSFIGGAINWVLGYGNTPFQASGLIMGIVGGVIFCFAYSKYKLSKEKKQ